MGRYMIKFSKTGIIRYTSHLDMTRLFQRAFKRGSILLDYSKGFNPHPKMTLAQPLSLGFTSIGEYLEFETIKDLKTEDAKEALNKTLPDGIKIISCETLPQDGKSIASLVEYASYDLFIRGNWKGSPNNLLKEFIGQKSIIASKRQKNAQERKDIDIRPFINHIEIIEEQPTQTVLKTIIATGSKANLNPELLISALSAFAKINEEPFEVIQIQRNDLLAVELATEKLIPLSSLSL